MRIQARRRAPTPWHDRDLQARAVLLAAVRPDGRGFRYEAMLPLALAGNRVQVLAATLRGDVASATFALEQRP